MRVSAIINPRAGSIQLELVKRKISEALFRCDLHIHICDDRDSLCKFVTSEIKKNTDAFLICGGDGTINSTLQCMIQFQKPAIPLPPICLIASGTANDLSHEMDVSRRVDEAARLLLEGKEKGIDLIEIQAGSEKKYMLTNGGIGIPAMAADQANLLRHNVEQALSGQATAGIAQMLAGYAQKTVKASGSLIYSATLLNTMRNWDQKDWNLEIELPNNQVILSQAPFVLINNQPTVGKKFLTAPYTAHNDGNVNLLLIESTHVLGQLKEIFRVFQGNLRTHEKVKSFEINEFRIRSTNKNRPLTFFGDGEILFRDVNEVKVRCLKRNIRVMIKDET